MDHRIELGKLPLNHLKVFLESVFSPGEGITLIHMCGFVLRETQRKEISFPQFKDSIEHQTIKKDVVSILIKILAILDSKTRTDQLNMLKDIFSVEIDLRFEEKQTQ